MSTTASRVSCNHRHYDEEYHAASTSGARPPIVARRGEEALTCTSRSKVSLCKPNDISKSYATASCPRRSMPLPSTTKSASHATVTEVVFTNAAMGAAGAPGEMGTVAQGVIKSKSCMRW